MLPQNVAGKWRRNRQKAFTTQSHNITSVHLHECLEIVYLQRELTLGPVEPDENVLGGPLTGICKGKVHRSVESTLASTLPDSSPRSSAHDPLETHLLCLHCLTLKTSPQKLINMRGDWNKFRKFHRQINEGKCATKG